MKISNTKTLKKNNQFLILNEIIDNQPISRAELTNKLNVSHTTIFTIVKELMNQGLVIETGFSESSGGRRPKLLEFNGENKYIISVEIEEKKLFYALFDLNFELQFKAEISLANIDFQDLLDNLYKVIISKLDKKEIKYEKIVGLGLSIPGIYKEQEDEVIDAITKIIERKGVKKAFQKKFMLPVYLENDANLAAYYEWSYGIAQNYNNIVYIFMGEGIGGGIIINNQLYRGGHGNAGEIGHIKVKASGKKCVCGGVGCLESIASIPELENTFNERIEKGEESIIQDIKEGPYNFEDIMLAAGKNDYLANNIIEEVYRYTVIGISNLVNIFDPELLIIGGRFNIFDSSFFDDLKKDLSQITFANIVEDLEVKTSTRKCEFQLKAAAAFVFDKWKQKI